MIWLWFVDTSRRTDCLLLFAMACIDAALALVVVVSAGFGLAAIGLTVLLIALIAATGYAWTEWKREDERKGRRALQAVKIRPSR